MKNKILLLLLTLSVNLISQNKITVSVTGSSGSAGGGTVDSVSISTSNGVIGGVSAPTTMPNISIGLGNITPTSVAASGTVTGSNLSGTNTGDNAVNTNYANDYRAGNFVAGTNYQAPLVSGTSIKTINGNTILGGGDLIIASGGTNYWTLDGSNNITKNNSGNVGINTTPNSPLSVAATSTANSASIGYFQNFGGDRYVWIKNGSTSLSNDWTLGVQGGISLQDQNGGLKARIKAGGTFGTAGQVLTSGGDGANVYWGAAGGGGGGGDITDVIAGTGLSGGATSGSATISAQTTSAIWNANQIQSRAVSSVAPSNGQVLKYNSTTSQWTPDSDLNGGGGGSVTNLGLFSSSGGSYAILPSNASGNGTSVRIFPGSNISLTPNGNDLTISATGGGSSIYGSATSNGINNTTGVGGYQSLTFQNNSPLNGGSLSGGVTPTSSGLTITSTGIYEISFSADFNFTASTTNVHTTEVLCTAGSAFSTLTSSRDPNTAGTNSASYSASKSFIVNLTVGNTITIDVNTGGAANVSVHSVYVFAKKI